MTPSQTATSPRGSLTLFCGPDDHKTLSFSGYMHGFIAGQYSIGCPAQPTSSSQTTDLLPTPLDICRIDGYRQLQCQSRCLNGRGEAAKTYHVACNRRIRPSFVQPLPDPLQTCRAFRLHPPEAHVVVNGIRLDVEYDIYTIRLHHLRNHRRIVHDHLHPTR